MHLHCALAKVRSRHDSRLRADRAAIGIPCWRFVVFLALALPGSWCGAHAEDYTAVWNIEAWVIASLAVAAVLYVRGVRALWRATARGRGITGVNVSCFAAGWLAVALALASPLDALGEALFWVHMVQHEVLMLVAAPLLVLGRPLAAWAWAVPPGWLRALARPARLAIVRRGWRALTAPFPAWLFHAAALWLWHVPVLFNAALASDAWHVLQHLSFFATALVFWWACLGHWWGRPASGAAVIYILTTMMHTGALGALLTLSRTPWYANTPEPWGWTPLEDQQLGGLIMWVPAGAVYLAFGLALFARWLDPPTRAPSGPPLMHALPPDRRATIPQWRSPLPPRAPRKARPEAR
jgi:putative membrane protein